MRHVRFYALVLAKEFQPELARTRDAQFVERCSEVPETLVHRVRVRNAAINILARACSVADDPERLDSLWQLNRGHFPATPLVVVHTVSRSERCLTSGKVAELFHEPQSSDTQIRPDCLRVTLGGNRFCAAHARFRHPAHRQRGSRFDSTSAAPTSFLA